MTLNLLDKGLERNEELIVLIFAKLLIVNFDEYADKRPILSEFFDSINYLPERVLQIKLVSQGVPEVDRAEFFVNKLILLHVSKDSHNGIDVLGSYFERLAD